MAFLPLLDDAFLSSHWHREYEAFKASPDADALLKRLQAWNSREVLKETSSEAAFIHRFFVETWGYRTQGGDTDGHYSCRPQFEIAKAGQTGGKGSADLALGHFGPDADGVPQALCEFKDIRSGLDARQNRKGNTRSPVDQAFDYLQGAYASRNRDALVTPFWTLVTDMREFRLYARDKGKAQYQRFVLTDSNDPRVPALLGDSESARFRRFVFWRMFQPDLLLADRGAPALDDLIRDQVTREKVIEKTFYHEYRAYRETVYHAIREANPGFTGTRGKLVRLTQRFLDRCIFILFCEDMGHTLRYPPELLRDMLIEESNSKYYHADDSACWDHMKRLFRAMRDGGPFGEHAIDKFNGGLFEEDSELEGLHIPTKVFCTAKQGAEGGKSLSKYPETLLYFSAAYNFGHRDGSGERVINLYTLGRIFEQSITELEIMEAEADERVSINKITKRKTDGVYYTPEWVTFYIVENTVGTRLADIKADLGFDALPPLDETAVAEYRAFQKDKRRTARTAGLHRDFLKDYRRRLETLRVVDPACGSGAFLIQALNRLMDEYRWIAGEQERLEGQAELFDQDAILRSILSHNLYGVDINPESVEITKLALWLHTAAPGKPLCALDRNIQCGNSLVAPDFYDTRQSDLFDEDQKERVNVFDWKDAFPDVFAHDGFDCVIGNPPYIKLQHFRKAQEEVSDYISNHYASADSGNWDMYLPFIEKGVELLHPDGRMGYIAPNVWMVNDYGRSLRAWIKERG
ncbi:MAG: DNA methyltransferase, partial [Verrucomicrobiales bacterium]